MIHTRRVSARPPARVNASRAFFLRTHCRLAYCISDPPASANLCPAAASPTKSYPTPRADAAAPAAPGTGPAARNRDPTAVGRSRVASEAACGCEVPPLQQRELSASAASQLDPQPPCSRGGGRRGFREGGPGPARQAEAARRPGDWRCRATRPRGGGARAAGGSSASGPAPPLWLHRPGPPTPPYSRFSSLLFSSLLFPSPLLSSPLFLASLSLSRLHARPAARSIGTRRHTRRPRASPSAGSAAGACFWAASASQEGPSPGPRLRGPVGRSRCLAAAHPHHHMQHGLHPHHHVQRGPHQHHMQRGRSHGSPRPLGTARRPKSRRPPAGAGIAGSVFESPEAPALRLGPCGPGHAMP